jgi:flagellar hook-associated protein 2
MTTVQQSGSTTYVSGTSSGLDTQALIDAAVAQKTDKADRIDDQIDANTTKITAYQELDQLLEGLQTSIASLSATAVLSSDADGSDFDAKTGYVSTNDGTDAESLVSIGLDDGVADGTYSIVVAQKATAMKVNSDAQTGKDTALGMSGSFTLGADGSSDVTIGVTSDMTLQDIADAINTTSATSGVFASVLSLGNGEYSLVLTGTSLAKEISATDVAGNILQTLGLLDTGGDFKTVSQIAQQAVITFDGTELRSDTNNFENILPGLSISIVNAAPSTTITLEVETDVAAVQESIEAFIEAYNALKDFIATQQSVTEEAGLSEDAVLFADSILREIDRALSTMIASTVGSGDTVTSLRDMGINLNADGSMEIEDSALLESTLLNNLDDVRVLFETQTTSSSSSLTLIRNSTSTSSVDLSFEITMNGDGSIASVTANGSTDDFTVSGNLITGKAGTAYAGMVFSYYGDSNTVTVSVDQGLGDRLYNTLKRYTDDDTGVIAKEIDRITETNGDLETQSDRIRERASNYEDTLIDRYAAMESKVEAAKLLQKQIQALLGNSGDDDD